MSQISVSMIIEKNQIKFNEIYHLEIQNLCLRVCNTEEQPNSFKTMIFSKTTTVQDIIERLWYAFRTIDAATFEEEFFYICQCMQICNNVHSAI